MKKEIPSYYAVIPASVRYDSQLPAGAKLLFGEVTALSNQKGYCFASNGYFANLYSCSPQAISKWFKMLEQAGHVKITYSGEAGSLERRVSTVVEGYQPQLRGVSTVVEGVSTVVEHNNTSIIIQEGIREDAPAQEPRHSQPTIISQPQTPPPDSAPPPSPKRSRFATPGLDEIICYMEDLAADPKWLPRFVANPDETGIRVHSYYESNGWKVGRNQMKDWKAACRNWLLNNEKYGGKKHVPGAPARIVSEDTHRRAFAITLSELGITGE